MTEMKELRLAEAASEAVGILQRGELDAHALVVMAHHTTAHAAKDNHSINRRARLDGDRGAA